MILSCLLLAVITLIGSTARAADIIEPPMASVPGGVFTMGRTGTNANKDYPREAPAHQVRVSAFQLSKYEVTVGQFRQFIEATRHRPASYCWKLAANDWSMDIDAGTWDSPAYAPSELHPVMCVSWLDAKAYVDWLAAQTGKAYRLPSEAEWEYAARAGGSGAWHFGDDERQLCRYGNIRDVTGRAAISKITGKPGREAPCDDGAAFTSIPGMYAPNAFGLYDMIGNVSEYVMDCEHPNYEGAPADGSAWTKDCPKPMKMRRGGSYSSHGDSMHAARNHASPDNASSIGEGFRIALDGSVPPAVSAATRRFEAALAAKRKVK